VQQTDCLRVCARVCVSTFTNLKKRFEHIELPAKLLDYFLVSNKSNINQNMFVRVRVRVHVRMRTCVRMHVHVHVRVRVRVRLVYVQVSRCPNFQVSVCTNV